MLAVVSLEAKAFRKRRCSRSGAVDQSSRRIQVCRYEGWRRCVHWAGGAGPDGQRQRDKSTQHRG